MGDSLPRTPRPRPRCHNQRPYARVSRLWQVNAALTRMAASLTMAPLPEHTPDGSRTFEVVAVPGSAASLGTSRLIKTFAVHSLHWSEDSLQSPIGLLPCWSDDSSLDALDSPLAAALSQGVDVEIRPAVILHALDALSKYCHYWKEHDQSGEAGCYLITPEVITDFQVRGACFSSLLLFLRCLWVFCIRWGPPSASPLVLLLWQRNPLLFAPELRTFQARLSSTLTDTCHLM